MRWLAGLLLLAQAVLGQGGAGGPVASPSGEYLGERALFPCLEVLKGLEVQAFYREGPDLLVLLGRERPLLVLALEGGRLWPHPRPPRGRPLPKRPFPFLRELTLAPWVLEVEGEYRCFVLHRGRVVGILRLDQDLRPLPLGGMGNQHLRLRRRRFRERHQDLERRRDLGPDLLDQRV